MKKIILLLTGIIFLSSCASPSRSRSLEGRQIGKRITAVGMYKAQLGDLIQMSLNERCSESSFISKARNINKVHNVVEIAMTETCDLEPGGVQTSCKCEYSGIAVHYTEIDNPDETKIWNSVIGQSSIMNNSFNTEKKPERTRSDHGKPTTTDGVEHR